MSIMYMVETWDTDLQEFTPQIGVHPGPYTLMGSRKALRALREYGYGGYPSTEPCVLLRQVEVDSNGKVVE